MTGLIHDRFLLGNEDAVRLYFDYAAELPIIDFHTHLPPAEIAANTHWENISQVWLNGDHYKWRQMRTNGVPERFCTGDATDRDKFDAFAGIVPYLLRNPLYHWCHLELARYFQIDDLLLSAETAGCGVGAEHGCVRQWPLRSFTFRNQQRARPVHHRRSDRFPGTPRGGCGRHIVQRSGVSHLASGPGAGVRRSWFVERLCGPIGRCRRCGDRHLRRV